MQKEDELNHTFDVDNISQHSELDEYSKFTVTQTRDRKLSKKNQKHKALHSHHSTGNEKVLNTINPESNFFSFEDNVFDFYRISKKDSIFGDNNLNDLHDLHDLQKNKYSSFFSEISELCSKLYQNKDFLKIYENLKPYLKFFYKSIKALDKENQNEIRDIKRILLVDDTNPILKALKNVTLNSIKELNLTNNLEIIYAYDGVDALALFKLDHYISQSIHYIISDHNMSMMEGSEFLTLVKKYKLGRQIKLYICSTDNVILKSLNMIDVEFVNKPARKSDIKKILSS